MAGAPRAAGRLFSQARALGSRARRHAAARRETCMIYNLPMDRQLAYSRQVRAPFIAKLRGSARGNRGAAYAQMASSSSNVNDVQRQVDEVKGVMCAPLLSSPVSAPAVLSRARHPAPASAVQAAERRHHAAEPRQDGGAREQVGRPRQPGQDVRRLAHHAHPSAGPPACFRPLHRLATRLAGFTSPPRTQGG